MSTLTEKVMVTAPATDGVAPGTLVPTAPGIPDLQLVPMTKLRQIIVRTVRTFLQNVVGNLTNVGLAGGVAVTTFANLTPEQQLALKQAVSALEFYQLLLIALSTAVSPAVIAFLQNLIELLADLDDPKTRA
jgi:hypothetical protein